VCINMLVGYKFVVHGAEAISCERHEGALLSSRKVKHWVCWCWWGLEAIVKEGVVSVEKVSRWRQ
jgi:hypothetical protein